MAKLLSDFSITNNTTYLALTGELWGVFREFFKEKCLWYIESALYRVPLCVQSLIRTHHMLRSSVTNDRYQSRVHCIIDNDVIMPSLFGDFPNDTMLLPWKMRMTSRVTTDINHTTGNGELSEARALICLVVSVSARVSIHCIIS